MSPTLRSVPAAPARAMLRDVGAGATNVAIEFEVRTAFDFSISLAREAGEHDEITPEDQRWLAAARAGIPELDQAKSEESAWSYAPPLAVDHPEVTDAASFVELLHRTSGRELATAALADVLRDPGRNQLIQAAVAGEPEAITAVLASWPEMKRPLLERLLRDGDTVIGEIATLFKSWLPRYQEIEPRIRAIIERDVELRAADRASLRPADLIERTTNGIRLLSEPGVRRVLLAPSYLARPYNFTFAGGDWRMFIYPVADSALGGADPLAPPPGVLRLHRALGDGTRLRILRLLRDRDWYLTEIAERLELSKPTIKHHLAQLRAAGLVTLTEEGGLSYYSLRRDRLDDASVELKHYLIS